MNFRPRRSKYVTRWEFDDFKRRVIAMAGATQQDVDNLKTELVGEEGTLTKVADDLRASSEKLQAEIDSLVANNAGIDVSGVQAEADTLRDKAAALDAAAQSVGDLQPTPSPNPNPDPNPTPPTP